MPVVPRIDNPPRIPRRPFSVCFASSSPLRMEIVTVTPTSSQESPSTSPRAWRIIRRGIGLMAGSPTANSSPVLVTVPMPMPAR